MTSKILVRTVVLGAICLATCVPGSTRASAAPYASDTHREVIEVAIALDTSGSMKGLIDAARLRLWAIVNDLTLLEPTPKLRVALLTYGNSKNDAKTGWVRLETDLTEDLDLVSARLFELTSEGGTEYVGRVLQTALGELSWTSSNDALKLIFVAGNEAADQDPQVSLQEMSALARREDVLVHAIFCGAEKHPQALTWKELADSVGSQFATIDHRYGTVVVKSPFDEELAELSAKINETYIPLGHDGRKRHENQVLQDENAAELSPAAAAGRAQTKISPLYSADWDLVDALAAGKVSLYEIDESELPATLREMTPMEREVYVEEMTRKRAEIRARIAELTAQRQQHVGEQMKAKGLDDSRAFDAVVRRAIREQVAERGLQSADR